MPNLLPVAVQAQPSRAGEGESAPTEPPQRTSKAIRAADGATQPIEAIVTAHTGRILLSPDQFVRRAIRLTGTPEDEKIAVAGPDGLAAMVSLCRAGLHRVECARQATCGGADEACGLLLLVGPMDAATLAETVRRTARLLRDDGVLVAQIQTPGDERCIRPALAALGLQVSFSLSDRPASRLAMHTIRRAAPARMAG